MNKAKYTVTDIEALMTPEEREKFRKGVKLWREMMTRKYLIYLFGGRSLPKDWIESKVQTKLSVDFLRDARMMIDHLIAKNSEEQ